VAIFYMKLQEQIILYRAANPLYCHLLIRFAVERLG